MSVDKKARREKLNLLRSGGRVQTHFAATHDIRNIMKRVRAGQEIPQSQPIFGDATIQPSLFDSMQSIIAGKEAFNSYPASFRAEFNNDPNRFLEKVLTDKEGTQKICDKYRVSIYKPVEEVKEPTPVLVKMVKEDENQGE